MFGYGLLYIIMVTKAVIVRYWPYALALGLAFTMGALVF